MDAGPLTRRQLLAWAGLAAASGGCTGGDTSTPAPFPEPSGAGPDARLVAQVVRGESRLVAAYHAFSAGTSRLERQLERLGGDHRKHVTALGGQLPSAAARAPTRPDRQVLRHLRGLEARAVESRRRQCLAARSGDLARVLAAMAASSAQHLVVLRGLAAAAPPRAAGR